MIKTIEKALWSFYPETPNWYDWAKIDSKGNKIPNSERMQTEHVIVNSVHKGIVTRPTDKQINDKIAELEKQYTDNEYQRKRLEEYNAIGIGEQLDMIYHDMDGWKKRIKSVKDKYPKPT
tara:strand:- start:238 stop:597 length:360 start_codon:yes stop_codon:yes gene_type:complete